MDAIFPDLCLCNRWSPARQPGVAVYAKKAREQLVKHFVKAFGMFVCPSTRLVGSPMRSKRADLVWFIYLSLQIPIS